jgi:hypothetical protein
VDLGHGEKGGDMRSLATHEPARLRTIERLRKQIWISPGSDIVFQTENVLYFITTCGKILLEDLIAAQIVKKFL